MKKYIITDPCYIIPSTDWDKCCKIFDSAEYKAAEESRDYKLQRELFDNEINKTLQEFSGDINAKATSTGYGDWTNSIWGKNVLKHDFFADSGMVCVCELTDNIRKVIDSRFIGMAVFETDKDIEIEFDWSDSDWTVVRIIDKDTGREIVSSQEPYSDDDDYDE